VEIAGQGDELEARVKPGFWLIPREIRKVR